MALDFNKAPYYDDYDQSKNFYRILFKPGRAVQARELTQLQSILQKQIESIGSNIFKEGSLVLGGKSFIGNGLFLKIGAANIDINNFINQRVIGQTSGATALVKKISQATTTLPAALYITNIEGEFENGEDVNIVNTSQTVTLSSDSLTFTGPCTFFSIEESIFFTKGNFVFCDTQSVVVSPTFQPVPTARLGLVVTESIVSSGEDDTLLDPAIGTNNYFAPGADRYKIELTLKTIEYNPNIENSDSEVLENFIEICNIRYGDVIKLTTDSDYNKLEDTLAKRTYDESGDYTVKPFIATVQEHLYGNAAQISVSLTPGKAYVKGYSFETIASTSITIDKSRETNRVDTFPIEADYARYVLVSNISGFFNPITSSKIDIHKNNIATVNLTTPSHYANSIIGNARVRYYEQSADNVFKLYLYDMKLNEGNTFSSANSFFIANTIPSPVVMLARANATNQGAATITYGNDDTMLFKVPQQYVKTFTPGGISETLFTSLKLYESTQFVPGTGSETGNSIATITAGANELFVGTGTLSLDEINVRYFGAVTSSTGSPAVLEQVKFKSVIISGDKSTATLKVGSGATFFANVLALHSTGAAASKLKTLTQATKIINFPDQVSDISLSYADVAYVSKIQDWEGNSYIGEYIFDSGQRDDFYDHGTLRLKTGGTGPTLDAVNNPNVIIEFAYYAHSGSGFFSVDSYTNSGITYEKIPTFTSSRGEIYSLADVIDFRPVRAPSSNSILFTKIVEPGSSIIADYEYYLGRIDKIVIGKDKQFKVIRGTSSLAPVVPEDDPDSMSVYSVTIPPYTKKASDVKLGFVENRRYTMRDIGKLEKRINRLEYYTALSLLEKIAADQKIPSSVPGIDRFKNGILVDPFAGHGIGDVANKDYVCSIDSEKRLLRPAFVSDAYSYIIDEGSSLNYAFTGDLITPSYTETPYVSQLQATKTVNLTPFEVFTYNGEMALTPATDIWHDTITKPSVTINVNGENDAFTVIDQEASDLNPWVTKYNAWQSVFRGVTGVDIGTAVSSTVDTVLVPDAAGNLAPQSTSRSSATTTTNVNTAESFARTGLSINASQKTLTTSLGEKIVDASLVPFIRSRPVTFVAKNLKPNTIMFATFNNVNVTDYCFPAIEMKLDSAVPSDKKITEVYTGTSWGNVILQKSDIIYYVPDVTKPNFSTGSVTLIIKDGTTLTRSATAITVNQELKTNRFGDLSGVFNIPNNQEIKFNVGEIPFRVADNLDKTFITTAAQTTYVAQGISTTSQETTLSTRINTVSINPVLDIKTDQTSTSVNQNTSSLDSTGAVSSVAIPATVNIDKAETNIIQPVTNVYEVGPGYSDPTPVVEVVNYGMQEFFCGQDQKASGKTGTKTYKINLGQGSLGRANVICKSFKVPDNFILDYGGKKQESGFMTDTTNTTTIATYNKELSLKGRPEITKTGTAQHVFTIYKNSADIEYAYLTIDAPFKTTGWNFVVQCPTGSVNPAAGTAKITGPKDPSFTFLADFDSYASKKDLAANRPRVTASLKQGYQFTITNTSSDPTWKNPGDGVIRVNGITIDTSKIKESRTGAQTQFGVETTGTSFWVYDGARALKNHKVYSRNVATRPNDENPTWTNTLGTLPVDIPKGESRTFTVFVDHPKDSLVSGKFTVNLNITNTTGDKPVPHNNPVFDIKTNDLNASNIVDPVAQTFFVDSTTYPAGTFVSSVDLWFAEKDDSVPVTVEIRPVVNGYPSSLEIMPFGVTTVDADTITVSAVANTPSTTEFTKFIFNNPVFLSPGQYALVIKGPSQKYRIYTAVLGDFLLNQPDQRVSAQPYIGSMFKSQNASTWSPEQYEDIMFRVNTATFDTVNQAVVNLVSESPIQNVRYDVFYTYGETLSFADTGASYFYRSTDESSQTLSGLVPYQLGKNEAMKERKIILKNQGDTLRFSLNLNTNIEAIAPVVDLNRLSAVLVKNIINNDSTGEDGFSGGNANARYITRRVTLAPGFEAQDLKVYINAFCPGVSSFKVYCKVNKPGTSNFDTQNKYQELSLISEDGNKRESFAEFLYGGGNNRVLSDGAKFNTFTIKIVMLSSDPVYVPFFKDMRVLAVDDY